MARGSYTSAAIAGHAAVAADPLRESVQRALIELNLAEGNLAAAAQRHDAFAKTLRSELGLDPSALMGVLMRRVYATAPESRPPDPNLGYATRSAS